MRILIVSDKLLLKELVQNGIIAKLPRAINCTTEIAPDFRNYDIVILWTHPGDTRDYTDLRQMGDSMGNFIYQEFPLKITYWERIIEVTDAWGKPMTMLAKEHPDYFFPSKYRELLLKQSGELMKHELLRKKKLKVNSGVH